MKKLLATITVALGLSAGGAMAQECGDISMAEFNWASGELMANVDKFILEEGYGCDVELVIGGTSSIFASMNEKSVPDVAGEQWVNSVRVQVDAAIAEGRLHALNPAPILGLGEGWWVPEFTKAENPELKTVLDWIEHPELFPSAEDPSKGAFIGCPAGWGCQQNNQTLFEAFDMEAKGWVLIDPGSAAGLDASIAKANERGDNWIGYYWSPTSIIGKYNMQPIPWGVDYLGDDYWNACISQPDCVDPQPTSWIKSEVFTIVTDDFLNAGGEINEYFKARVYPGEVMGSMLVYMENEQADGEDAAIEFMIRHEDVWSTWVSDEVAAKLRDAL